MNTEKELIQIFMEERYSKTKIWEKTKALLISKYSSFDENYSKACQAIDDYIEKANNYYPQKQRRIGFLLQWIEDSLEDEENNWEMDVIFTILVPLLKGQFRATSYGRSGAIPYQIPAMALAKLIHTDNYQAPDCKTGKMTDYSQLEAIYTASELVAVICESDLYDVYLPKSSKGGSLSVESNIKLTDEDAIYFNSVKYMPPMITPPKEITCNNQGSGYYTIKDHVILGHLNQHNKPVALDVLNYINSTPLSLDLNILEMEEKSNKPLDTERKKQAFALWRETSREVYDELLQNGNVFYLTHKYEMRGRMFTQGYHVNIQSMEYKKALINLAEKEVIV